MSLELDRIINTEGVVPLVVSMNSEKREVYVGSVEPDIQVYSTDSGQLLRSLSGHRGRVSSLLYCSHHRVLFSGSLDHVLLVWSTAKSEILTRHKFGSPVFSMCYNKRLGQLYAGGDKGIYVYSFTMKGKAKLTPLVYFQDHNEIVSGIVCTPSGRIFTGSYDQSVCSYDQNLDNIPEFLSSQMCHERGITAVDIDPNMNILMTSSYDKMVKVWATDQRRSLRITQVLDLANTVTGIAYVAVTGSVWVACKGSAPMVFDPRTGTNLTDFLPKDKRLDDVRITKLFASDGGQILVGCADDRRLAIWRYNPQASISVMHGHTDWVEVVKLFPTHPNRLMSAGGDSGIRLWESPSHMYPGLMTMSGVLHGHRGSVLCAAFSEDGDILLTASDDCTIRAWNVTEDPEKLNLGDPCKYVMQGHVARITGLCVVGHLLISVSWDQSIRFWDINTGTFWLAIPHAHDTAINDVAAGGEQGDEFATCSGDHLCYIWNIGNQQATAVLMGHESDVTHIIWNAVINCWATASDDMTVRLWNSRGNCLYSMHMDGWEGFTALGADKKTGWCLVGLKDNSLHVVDVIQDFTIQVHRGHADAIRCVEHSLDKNIYITASWDHTVRVWKAHIKGRSSSNHITTTQSKAAIMVEDHEKVKAKGYADEHPILEPKSLSEPNTRDLTAIPTRSARDDGAITALDIREQSKKQSRCSQMLADLEDHLMKQYFYVRRTDSVTTPMGTGGLGGAKAAKRFPSNNNNNNNSGSASNNSSMQQQQRLPPIIRSESTMPPKRAASVMLSRMPSRSHTSMA